jgi:hypothetical protein
MMTHCHTSATPNHSSSLLFPLLASAKFVLLGVGCTVGCAVGGVGCNVGAGVGTGVGAGVGTGVGAGIGSCVGIQVLEVGESVVGRADDGCCVVGASVGTRVGACVGVCVGAVVGDIVGTDVGTPVGTPDGDAEGVAVGASVVGGNVGGTKKSCQAEHRLHETGQSIRNTSPRLPVAEHSAVRPLAHVTLATPLVAK